MKKKGFTLAETLIALTIIGVIAGIMFPIMTKTQPNKEMVMLKKAYYNVTRIVTELVNDEGYYPDGDSPETSGFSHTEIADVNDGQEATFHNIVYSGDSKFCGLFAAKLNKTGGVENPCAARVSLAAGGNFRTPDGVTWSMPVGNFSDGSEDIYVDVDGPTRGHNCTADGAVDGLTTCAENISPDQFIIRVGRHGKVSLPGQIARRYVASNNTTKRYHEFLSELEVAELNPDGSGGGKIFFNPNDFHTSGGGDDEDVTSKKITDKEEIGGGFFEEITKTPTSEVITTSGIKFDVNDDYSNSGVTTTTTTNTTEDDDDDVIVSDDSDVLDNPVTITKNDPVATTLGTEVQIGHNITNGSNVLSDILSDVNAHTATQGPGAPSDTNITQELGIPTDVTVHTTTQGTGTQTGTPSTQGGGSSSSNNNPSGSNNDVLQNLLNNLNNNNNNNNNSNNQSGGSSTGTRTTPNLPGVTRPGFGR